MFLAKRIPNLKFGTCSMKVFFIARFSSVNQYEIRLTGEWDIRLDRTENRDCVAYAPLT